MVNNVLQCVQACLQKAKVLQSLKESSTTDGPEGTVSNKCLKSLKLLKKSLSSIKANIQDVRQRNVRQDNTMDRAGTLPLNLYETETVLKPVNLNPLIGVERVQSESDEDSSLPPESADNEQVDRFSDSDSDSDDEVDSARS